jgi:CubicO group peptidase (beta-lactamase class C family)
VEISKVISVSESEISVLARSVGGSFITYSFELDPATSKFTAFRIEPGDAPSASSPSAVVYPAPKTQRELLDTTAKLFADLAKADAFSGVAMIAKDDKPLFAKAYGYADAANKTSNQIDTKFNLGSINKIFTRIAIGQLISQGKLSYNDKLSKILPDYPNRDAANKITIGNLVTMTSGIGDFFNDRFLAMDKGKLRSLQDYLPLFANANDPLEFEPGTKNRYSNGGYVVLGLVIEKLSGKSYFDYVRDNIFKPAGMNDTDSFEMDKLPPNTAYGYLPGNIRNDKSLPARGSSAGGGYSTAADLLKFSNALRNKKLSIPDDNGGFPADFKGTGIAGGSEGVNALFIVNGQTGYTIIVLSNYEPPSAEKPGMQVRDWLKQFQQ